MAKPSSHSSLSSLSAFFGGNLKTFGLFSGFFDAYVLLYYIKKIMYSCGDKAEFLAAISRNSLFLYYKSLIFLWKPWYFPTEIFGEK